MKVVIAAKLKRGGKSTTHTLDLGRGRDESVMHNNNKIKHT